MLLPDVNFDAVAVGYLDAQGRCVAGRVRGDNLGLHAELILPFAMPPDRSNGCGGLLVVRSETGSELGFHQILSGWMVSCRM